MLAVQLGIDVGKARIGVAASDALGTLAFPVETVPRSTPTAQQQGEFEQLWQQCQPELPADLQRLLALVAEYRAQAVIVGHPKNLRGENTPSTVDAEFFAAALATAMQNSDNPVPVLLLDERLSTKTAQQQLHAAGKKTKQSRAMIDQAAAVVILQHALEMSAISGKFSGTVVAGLSITAAAADSDAISLTATAVANARS